MSDFLIRDIDPHVLEQLRRRAEQHGRSLQAEIKLILKSSTKMTKEEMLESSRRFIAETRGRSTVTSAELIREDRDR